jgi:NAD(P)-dependent dehydrogenase (short-subunit alcohol dehydrogenase family)
MADRLRGKVALITGAATAALFAREGAAVAYLAGGLGSPGGHSRPDCDKIAVEKVRAACDARHDPAFVV